MVSNDKILIYGIQILFVFAISFGSQSVQFENVHNWVIVVARYVVYMLMMKGSHEVCVLGYRALHSRHSINVGSLWGQSKSYLTLFAAAIALMVYYKQKLLSEDFLLMFVGYLITQYPEMKQNSSTINYGVGMAYSYFEGYLSHMIPGDGSRYMGFEENVSVYEACQGVVFPVKRLFIVITKSLYCPPDLKHFNKNNRHVPYLEACRSLEDVEKDVAGVKNRTYRNSAYKIYRQGAPPVHLAVECATPLHTLHRVLQKKAIYDELVGVEPSALVEDFCSMLRSVVWRNPETRNKCELVFYDDTDPSQNLAEVLLNKIGELEPDFESIIRSNH